MADNFVAEHVFEHFHPWQTFYCLCQCRRNLKAGGKLRVAVPDGRRPDQKYYEEVKIGKDGHKVLFTAESLSRLLESAGFKVDLLEYYNEEGEFITRPWNEDDGKILRSKRFDHQTEFAYGDHFYTSIIADAVNSDPPDHTVTFEDKKSYPDTVFVVVPTFNRMQTTLTCLDMLRQQTYSPIKIIVADGGSTDGTREAIRENYPDVILLTPRRGQWWWAGSMAAGMKHARRLSQNDQDMIMMVNDDTIFPFDYIEKLVNTAQEHGAVASAPVAFADNPDDIVLAGEFLNWEKPAYLSIRDHIEDSVGYYDDSDTLSSYGCIIPMYMVRKTGVVRSFLTPHYTADYDYFCRIKKKGYKIVIVCNTIILTQRNQRKPPTTKQRLFSRVTPDSVFPQVMLQARHCPKRLMPRRFYFYIMGKLNRLANRARFFLERHGYHKRKAQAKHYWMRAKQIGLKLMGRKLS